MKKRSIYTGSIWASFIALAAFYALIIKGYEAKAYSFSFSSNIIFIVISFGLVFIYKVILKADKFSKVRYPKVLVGVGSGLIALGIVFVAPRSILGPEYSHAFLNPECTICGYVISLIGTVILILLTTLYASQRL